jgi:hypothetical protein
MGLKEAHRDPCLKGPDLKSLFRLPPHTSLCYSIDVRVRVRVRVTLQLTVSLSVCLGVEHNLGLLTRDFFFLKVTVLSYLGRPL